MGYKTILALALLLVLAIPFSTAALNDSILAAYTFPTDGDLTDKTGNGNTALITVGNMNFTSAGVNGGAYFSDGLNDGLEWLSNTGPTSTGTDWSLGFWVFDQDTGVQNDTPYYFDQGPTFRFIMLFADSDTQRNVSFILNGERHDSNVSTAIDEWKHHLVTRDADRYVYYLDGVPIINTSSAQGIIMDDNQVRRFFLQYNAANQDVGGIIDEIYMWDRAVTSDEANTLGSGGPTGFYPFPTLNPPTAPTSLNATNISDTRIDLVWTDTSTTESGFQIERCEGVACTDYVGITNVTFNTQSYSDTGLTQNTTYRYRVKALNATQGDSGYTNTATATTNVTPPPPPTSEPQDTNPAQVIFSVLIGIAIIIAILQQTGFLNDVNIGGLKGVNLLRGILFVIGILVIAGVLTGLI